MGWAKTSCGDGSSLAGAMGSTGTSSLGALGHFLTGSAMAPPVGVSMTRWVAPALPLRGAAVPSSESFTSVAPCLVSAALASARRLLVLAGNFLELAALASLINFLIPRFIWREGF